MTMHTQTGPVIVTRGLTRHFTARKQTVEAVFAPDQEGRQGDQDHQYAQHPHRHQRAEGAEQLHEPVVDGGEEGHGGLRP